MAGAGIVRLVCLQSQQREAMWSHSVLKTIRIRALCVHCLQRRGTKSLARPLAATKCRMGPGPWLGTRSVAGNTGRGPCYNNSRSTRTLRTFAVRRRSYLTLRCKRSEFACPACIVYNAEERRAWRGLWPQPHVAWAPVCGWEHGLRLETRARGPCYMKSIWTLHENHT